MPVEKTVRVKRFLRKPTTATRWCYFFSELHLRERLFCTLYDGTEDSTHYVWTAWNWPLRWREMRKREEEWCGRRLLTPTPQK